MLACYVYINSFTLSMGAAMVFAIAPDTPPIRKSVITLLAPPYYCCAIILNKKDKIKFN
jgi:hypothetical protein